MALGNYMFGNISLEIAMSNIVAANIVQGMGMGFLFAPLTTLATATLRNEQMGNASGLFNLVRSVVGGIGISATTSFIIRSAQRQQVFLVARLTPCDAAYQQRMARMKAALSPVTGAPQADSPAYAAVYGLLLQQAHLAAYVECLAPAGPRGAAGAARIGWHETVAGTWRDQGAVRVSSFRIRDAA